MVKNNYQHSTSQAKTSAILPIHIVKESTDHSVVNRKIVRFQINAGETYQISYRYFIPVGYHLSSNSQRKVSCRLVNGHLSVGSVTFIYVKNGAAQQPQQPVNHQPSASSQAKPITVKYVDTSNNQVVKNGKVYGNYGQVINVMNRIKLPAGYHLYNGQKTVFKIKSYSQQTRLLVYRHRQQQPQQSTSPVHQASTQPVQSTRPAPARPAARPSQPTAQSSAALHIPSLDRDLQTYRHRLSVQLLNATRQHSMSTYQKIVDQLLRARGYADASQVQFVPKDHEVSGVARQHPHDRDRDHIVYVRARRYDANHPVIISELRDFCTCVVDNYANRGIFVTTSSFNDEDRKEAQRHSITLIDGQRLARLMIKHQIGTTVRRVCRISGIDRQFFA